MLVRAVGKTAALREALTRAGSVATSDEVRALIAGFATGETAGPSRSDAAEDQRTDLPTTACEDIVAALQRDDSGLQPRR